MAHFAGNIPDRANRRDDSERDQPAKRKRCVVLDASRARSVRNGFVYRRGDEAEDGRIMHAIWEDLCRAHLVLVDLTGANLTSARSGASGASRTKDSNFLRKDIPPGMLHILRLTMVLSLALVARGMVSAQTVPTELSVLTARARVSSPVVGATEDVAFF